MSTIKNTKKTFVKYLLLNQKSVKDKSLLKKIRMKPTLSVKTLDHML